MATSSGTEINKSTAASSESNSTKATQSVQALKNSATDRPHTPVDDLIEALTTTIWPQTWADQGGPGTICEYGGLLIINQTAAVHSEVSELLDEISTRLVSRSAK